jgi:hypothetical protein
MPISTPSFGSDDERDSGIQNEDLYETESMDFPGLSPAVAEGLLKRLGGGVVGKHELVEGIGWKARIEETSDGVIVHFNAHDELLDDLLRRFEIQAEGEINR